MTIGLVAQNSSSEKFIVRSIVGNLYANGYLVGNLSNFGLITILPNSQQTIYVRVRMNLLSIVNDIVRAFQMANFSQDLKLDGNANVDNYQIPIKLNFQIGLRKQVPVPIDTVI